jgi:hypothetical protein
MQDEMISNAQFTRKKNILNRAFDADVRRSAPGFGIRTPLIAGIPRRLVVRRHWLLLSRDRMD